MKVKLDENLPRQIAVELRARAHDVQTVGEEGFTGRADADVLQAAQREGRLLITQDLDFSDTRKFQPCCRSLSDSIGGTRSRGGYDKPKACRHLLLQQPEGRPTLMAAVNFRAARNSAAAGLQFVKR
jgi:hypothetical protein